MILNKPVLQLLLFFFVVLSDLKVIPNLIMFGFVSFMPIYFPLNALQLRIE